MRSANIDIADRKYTLWQIQSTSADSWLFLKIFFLFQARPCNLRVDPSYVGHLNRLAVRSKQLVCGDNCFRLAMNCRQDPKYDRNADVLISLIAALANGTGGVIFLRNLVGDMHLATGKERELFATCLWNFLKTSLSHINTHSVLMEHFDDRVEDSNIMWMFILVKIHPTHLLAGTMEGGTKAIYRVNEHGKIVIQHIHVPHPHQEAVGAGEGHDNAALSEDSATSTGCISSGELTSLAEPQGQPEVKDEDIAKMLSTDKPDQLSWTKNKINWRKNLNVEPMV